MNVFFLFSQVVSHPFSKRTSRRTWLAGRPPLRPLPSSCSMWTPPTSARTRSTWLARIVRVRSVPVLTRSPDPWLGSWPESFVLWGKFLFYLLFFIFYCWPVCRGDCVHFGNLRKMSGHFFFAFYFVYADISQQPVYILKLFGYADLFYYLFKPHLIFACTEGRFFKHPWLLFRVNV